jgi:DNA polymerase-1
VIVCFDAGGNSRKIESDTYKANRKPLDPDFIVENQILRDEALYALGLEAVGMRGYEADDLIYTYSHIAQFGMDKFDEVIIATVDQDLLQCVTERCAVLLWNGVKKQQMMWVPEVMEKWGCEPADIRLVKALCGDSSDNIKGVKGIGPKTALKLLTGASWDLSEVLKDEKIAPHADQVMENLELVTLKNMAGVIGPFRWDDYKIGMGMKDDYTNFLEKYEFTSLQKRAESTSEMLSLR